MIDKIKQLHLQARKDKDELRKNVYTLILGELQLAETRGTTVDDKYILQVVRKLKVSCEENARLGAKEAEEEAAICEELLPKFVSSDELKGMIDKDEVKTSDKPLALIGKYIGKFKESGINADPKMVSDIINSYINERKQEIAEAKEKAYAENGEEPPNEYHAYQHVEKLSSSATEGILNGTVYVFPKIDGTNAQIWLDAAGMHYGSRKRELEKGRDNAGFMEWAVTQPKIQECLEVMNAKFGQVSLFGEWLVPHTLKTYSEDAWRRFWVFDVFVPAENRYIPYEEYQPLLATYGIDYIPYLAKLDNPEQDALMELANKNTFLIQEDKGLGEGVVLKNYEFKNKWHRIVWAKIVLSEFKSKTRRNIEKKNLEDGLRETEMVEMFYTKDIAEKILANILSEQGGEWDSKLLGRLIQTCWYDFVNECMWDIVKKFKNPIIDFKLLKKYVDERTKEHLPELF
jgi:uncharacterized protein YqeY